jgi:riboflavin kinase
MSYLFPSSLDHSKVAKNKNSIDRSEYLNLPDLKFFQWCQQQYKLKKGIYHTIDNWFYEYGVVPITYRRIYILAFLEFAQVEEIETKKYIQFGKGGLSRKLDQFIKETEKEKYMI